MTCTNCGSNIPDGSKFCPTCGTPAPAQQQNNTKPTGYCPRCGQPYYGTPFNCPSCGAPLPTNQGQQSQGAAQGFQNVNFNQYFPNSGTGRVPNRNIALYVILSIVTCGIFLIYWMICVVNDLNNASDQPNDTNGVVVYLLSLVTCGIYGVYWMYKAGEKVEVVKRKLGEPVSGNDGILYLVLQLFGFGLINYCLIQNELNKLSQRGI